MSRDGRPQPSQKFGTFLGVYTPSDLTILGLIMYLRFGWVVGNAGLALTIVIVLLANSITFITALSASAVATNMRVGVGGESRPSRTRAWWRSPRSTWCRPSRTARSAWPRPTPDS